MTDKDLNFQFASACDFEVHCSAFGISGMFLRIRDTNIIGVGSSMGLITGTTEGLIHYNDAADFKNQKYKLFVVVLDDGMLRIDFTKILKNKEVPQTPETDSPSLVFVGRCPESRPDNIEPFIGILSFECEDD